MTACSLIYCTQIWLYLMAVSTIVTWWSRYFKMPNFMLYYTLSFPAHLSYIFFLFSCRSQMTSKSGDNQKVAIKTCASMSPTFLPHLISFIIYYNCTGLKHLRFYLFYMITKHMLLLAKSSRDLITEELTNYKCFQLHINFKTLIDKPIWLFLLK